MLAIVREGRMRARAAAKATGVRGQSLTPLAQNILRASSPAKGLRASSPAKGLGMMRAASLRAPVLSASAVTVVSQHGRGDGSRAGAASGGFALDASMFQSFVEEPGGGASSRGRTTGRPVTAGSRRPPSAQQRGRPSVAMAVASDEAASVSRPTTAVSRSESPENSGRLVRPRSAQLAARAAADAARRERVGGDAGVSTAFLGRSSADISNLADAPGHGLLLPPWMPVDVGVVPPSILPESVYRVRRERAIPGAWCEPP